MTELSSPKEDTRPSVQFFHEYGVYKAPGSFIVSAPNWEVALQNVQSRKFGRSTVLLPELITVAGRDLHLVGEYQDDIEKALADFALFSKSQPDTTFVVGSPHFVSSGQPPYNGAFVFQNGEVINIFHKRLNAGEMPHLAMDPGRGVATAGGASLVICKDLMGTSFEDDEMAKGLLIRQSDPSIDEQTALQLARVPYVDKTSSTLFVIACWGVGMWSKNRPRTQDEINQYYKGSLLTTIRYTFRSNPHLQRIIMSDRAPTSLGITASSQVASRPMSFIASRRLLQ